MKKSKLLVLSLMAFTSISLASCGPDNSSSVENVSNNSVIENTSSEGNSTSTSTSSHSNSSSSSLPGKQYVVFIEDTAHVAV